MLNFSIGPDGPAVNCRLEPRLWALLPVTMGLGDKSDGRLSWALWKRASQGFTLGLRGLKTFAFSSCMLYAS